MGRIEIWSELLTNFFSLKSERPSRQLDGIQLIALLDWAASRCSHPGSKHDEKLCPNCLVILAKEATNLAKLPTSLKDEVRLEHILTAATAFRNLKLLAIHQCGFQWTDAMLLQVLSAELPHLQYVCVQCDVISLVAAAAFVQQCASLVGFRSRRVRWSRRPPPPLPMFHPPLLRGPSMYSSLPQLPPWRYPAPRISLDATQQQASMVGAALLSSVMPAPLRSLRLLPVVGQQDDLCDEQLELLSLSPQQRSQLQELKVWAGWPWVSVTALLQGCPHLVHLRVRCAQSSPPDWDALFYALQLCPLVKLTLVDLADTDDLNGVWGRRLQLEQLDYLDFRRSSDERVVSSETPLDVRELVVRLSRRCAERGHVWRYLGLAGSELVDEELLVRAAPRPQEPEVQLWVPKHIGEEDEMRGEADLDWVSDNDDGG
eukprot:gene26515-32041_t